MTRSCELVEGTIRLPGRLAVEAGSIDDYRALERFHYRRKRPATFAAIWTVRWRADDRAVDQPAAVLVLSWPVISLAARDRELGIAGWPEAWRIGYINAHVRTISRVIVHPRFRAVGLASRLVRHVLRHAPTRYVDALAMMGHAIPLFERAGMMRVGGRREDEPVYYLYESCPAG